MRLGTRGHDVQAANPEELCRKLIALGVNEIQLVAHKSFPDFQYSDANIQALAATLAKNDIRVAVYGCYIDPLTSEGEQRFIEHIRYAKMLNAGMIATETALGATKLQNDEDCYQKLVRVFRTFTEEGKKLGVRIGVETVSAHPICDGQKTKRLLDDVKADNLYVILDPHNLHDGDISVMRAMTEEAISLYGDRIAAVHWKDAFAVKEDPAFRFAEENSEAVVLITEGLTGEALTKVIGEIKNSSVHN